MKIKDILKSLIIVIILSLAANTSSSQVVVERSNIKVTIAGIPYYIHQVKKGETAYSISRAYGITVEDLMKENPTALYGLKEGQSLQIPVSMVSDVPVADILPAKVHDNTRFIYHRLKPGETVYSLSRAYGVSENEIILSNPGIEINKMPVNAEIAIPRREFMNDRQTFENQDRKYIYHEVMRGESLSSIAGKYGLTVRELRRENRDIRFPRVGDYIRIPVADLEEATVTEPFRADSLSLPEEEPVVPLGPSGFTPVKDLAGSLNVAVLLPLYLKENAVRTEIDSSTIIKGKKIYKPVRRPEEWIYPPSFDFVEMYEGILLAADTLRSLGLTVNLNTFDIKSDTVAISRLIQSGRLAGMDLIIGPVYSYNLAKVASYAKEYGIPVVSPVPLLNNFVLANNPTLFMTSSSLEVAQKALSEKISEYYDRNIVFIHSDTAGKDQDVRRFRNLIFNDLSYKVPFENIRFKEFIFYSRSMFDNDSINRLGHALSEKSGNIIVIASEDASVISETIQDIHGLSKKFDIEVFGYPAMIDIDNLDPMYLFDLDIMVYYPYWLDYNKSDVIRFNSHFLSKFETEPLEKS